ncbi:MAG TPA: hypothetical protein VND98_05080 [Solirubrobacterales bacterium]|nr:hypothetical protein [Solirubrobacterales bacterium]
MRADRIAQSPRMLAQLSGQSGPQPADALASLDNIAAAELTIPKQLEGDPIRDGPHRLHQSEASEGR